MATKQGKNKAVERAQKRRGKAGEQPSGFKKVNRKKRKPTAAKYNDGLLGRPLPEGLNARQDAIRRQRERDLQKQADELFLQRQLLLASEMEPVKNLFGLSRDVADMIFTAYESADDDLTVARRITVAVQAVRAKLTPEQRARKGAVDKAIICVREALNKAADEVKTRTWAADAA